MIIPTLGTRASELERLLSSLVDQTHQEIEIILISQDNHEDVDEIIKRVNGHLVINHVQLDRKGLSIARNSAIPYINGQVVTFSDDDCWYPTDSFEKVNRYFSNHPSTDVACYQIFDPTSNEYYKNYSAEDHTSLKFMQLFQRSSIEIFLSMKNISKDDIYFNEVFGLGAKYPSGEENILLTGLFKKGFRIAYQSDIAVYHAKPTKESRLTEASFKSKGPLFKQIFGSFIGLIMLTGLFVKKIRYLDQPFSFYGKAIKEMLQYKRT